MNEKAVDEICGFVQQVASFPLGNATYLAYKMNCVKHIALVMCGKRLPPEDELTLAEYWSDKTCNDHWGSMVQRIAARVLIHL